MAHMDYLAVIEDARDQVDNASHHVMEDRRPEAMADLEEALRGLDAVLAYFDGGNE